MHEAPNAVSSVLIQVIIGFPCLSHMSTSYPSIKTSVPGPCDHCRNRGAECHVDITKRRKRPYYFVSEEEFRDMQAILKSYLPDDDLTPETLRSLAQQCRHQKPPTPQPNPPPIATQPVAPSTPVSVSAFVAPSPPETTRKTPDGNSRENSDFEPNPDDAVLQDAVCFHQKLGCLLADSLGEYRRSRRFRPRIKNSRAEND